MRAIKAEPLSSEAFLPFGQYSRFINPDAVRIGEPPIEFFRDMVPLNLGGTNLPSFSVCRVEKREMIVDVAEYHSASGEGILPLDNDVIIHVAAATPPDREPPFAEFRAFHVPRGTFVALHPGVWHQAPFTVNNDPANCLIVLPPRMYAIDCIVVEFPEPERIRIEP